MVVAAETARLLGPRENAGSRPDYVVFFGCAGAIDPRDERSVFLVDEVRYASLGDVSKSSPNADELVQLKTKWLSADVQDASEGPVAPEYLPLTTGRQGFRNLSAETTLPAARVFATDAVVKVDPSAQPPRAGPGGLFVDKGWSYADALAYLRELSPNVPALVEMESFGIALTAAAIGMSGQVVAIRVATDALSNHSTQGGDERQAELLMRARGALLHVINTLFQGAQR